jgi:hypothetical protein
MTLQYQCKFDNGRELSVVGSFGQGGVSKSGGLESRSSGIDHMLPTNIIIDRHLLLYRAQLFDHDTLAGFKRTISGGLTQPMCTVLSTYPIFTIWA